MIRHNPLRNAAHWIWCAAFLLCPSQSTAQRNLSFCVEKNTKPSTIRCIGAEVDAHFHANHVPRSNGSQLTDWLEVIAPRIEKMGIQSMRVMVLPQWYEPQNDNDDPAITNWQAYTFNSEEMQSLYPILDLAERLHIPVTLVPWGAQPSSFLAQSKHDWIVAPENLEEYAENIAALLYHLIHTRGYHCIDELTPGNEPDGWQINAKQYIALCQALHTRLKKEHLLRYVKLNLIDNTDRGGRFDFIGECLEGLKGIAHVVNSHNYLFGYDTPSEEMEQWEAENCRLSARFNLRHCIGEFGSNQTVGASRQKDIDSYRRGVFIVRAALSFLAAGAYNLSYWQLFDQYYSKHDAYPQMQQLGMWRSVRNDYDSETYYPQLKEDYGVRPQYYAYSLLTQHIQPHAHIYRMTANNTLGLCNALCVRNANKQMVYVVANQEDTPLHITLHNKKHRINGQYARYIYCQNQLPKNDNLISPQAETLHTHGLLSDTIPANAVVVYKFL